MSKETDQKLAALDSRIRKKLKIAWFKLVAIGFACIPVIGWIPAYHFWRKAIRLHGPDLGNAPGRARMGTTEDLKRAGMRP